MVLALLFAATSVVWPPYGGCVAANEVVALPLDRMVCFAAATDPDASVAFGVRGRTLSFTALRAKEGVMWGCFPNGGWR